MMLKKIVYSNKILLVYTNSMNTFSRKIDIVTDKCLINCVYKDWSKSKNLTEEIEKLKKYCKDCQKIAASEGKPFELSSAFPLPEELKNWFMNNGIKFSEG